MHWLSCLLQISNPTQRSPPPTSGWERFKDFAPILSAHAAIANLGLAFIIYRYTQRKNLTDTRIKWFLELVYTPNREDLWRFFDQMHKLQEIVPANGQWTDKMKIDAVAFIKAEEKNLRKALLNVLETVAPSIYKEVDEAVVGLTDELSLAIGNDEHKLEHPKTYERLIYTPINSTKGTVVKALFKYSG